MPLRRWKIRGDASEKRGKFLASTYKEAEFWGRPLHQPEKVWVEKPLIGDQETIEKTIFGKRVSDEGVEMENRFALDAKIKKAALAKGYDSIVLMAPKAFAEFKKNGRCRAASN